MFYCYGQNNSGGVFHNTDKVGHWFIIEADSAREADAAAENKGIYFDGAGDCNCCGRRWSEAWEDGGRETPEIYGQSIKEFIAKIDFCFDGDVIHVYYKNGKHKKYPITKKQIEKNKAEKRKEADALWATCVNLNGVYSKNPIRVFKHEYLDDYYDKAGNLGIPGPGLTKKDLVTYFASKDKTEVERFIRTILVLHEEAYDTIESRMVDGDIAEQAKETALSCIRNFLR